MSQTGSVAIAERRSLDVPGVKPKSFAHAVFRTARFKEMTEFYMAFLNAHMVYGADTVAFITYDEEHHRVAFAYVPGAPDQIPEAAGLEHIAYTYRSFREVLGNYVRLKGLGIHPYWCINHGPTTSFYYRDPDGNQIETAADNFDDMAELMAFFESDTFKNNPLGVQFDPDRLAERYLNGDSEDELKRQGSAPIRPGTGYVNPVERTKA
jgi:catechol 2,3-dioxygenase-like lactoylglutathione lyase family enzyme